MEINILVQVVYLLERQRKWRKKWLPVLGMGYSVLSNYNATEQKSIIIDYFLTWHVHLFSPTMNRNSTFSCSTGVQSIKQISLRNRRYDVGLVSRAL